MSYSSVQERWEAFLSKIEERFHEILKQTEAALPTLLDYQNFDTTPFGNAWQGMEAQAKELIYKIQDTWQDKVSPAFDEIKEAEENRVEEAGHSLDDFYRGYYQLYNAEMNKGLDLGRRLAKELKSYEVRTFAEAARKLQKKATEILSGNFSCTQCKAPLPVKQNFFRSYYQTCDYCQTVNTFEPGALARNVEHFAVHPLAEEKALGEYFNYWNLEEDYKQQQEDEPMSIRKEQVVDAYKIYAERYLKARIEIIPEYQQQYEKDLESKVERVSKWLN